MGKHKQETAHRKESNNRRSNNALQAGIISFLRISRPDILEIKPLPKKYTSYPPLLILPVNFVSTTPEWQIAYEGLSPGEKQDLFASIAAAFKPQVITHIAINAAISTGTSHDGTENVMRSPSGIIPAYGDFGPTSLLHPGRTSGQPTQVDFDAAFWVSTTQNNGIVQTWAPLWTMFSRGNITEKARILGEGAGMRGLTEEELGQNLTHVDVADFYVGIGYFAFSYLRTGLRTVFGWEINGWSVEGLRRGCKRNGWKCLVVKANENGLIEGGGLEKIVHTLREQSDSGTCIVLWGDNRSAAKLLDNVQKRCIEEGISRLNFRHVNLGLLPTSKASWQSAVLMVHTEKGGWLHVHETVDIKEIETKRVQIVQEFERLINNTSASSWHASCCHVEHVKTYAPGVMHCVFDINIAPL